MKTPLYYLLFKTFHAQRNRNRVNMDEYHLSPGQPKVLRYIHNHHDCKLTDIATECDVENATVSKIIDNLESKGMLIRKLNPKNKRAYQIRLTQQGEEALDKWEKHCLDVEKISLEGFSEEEKEQFYQYLARMYTNLTNKKIF